MNLALDIIAKPTVILICAAVAALLLRRSSASMRHAVWILGIAGAVLLPIAAMLVPRLEWLILPDSSTSVTFLAVESAPAALGIAERGQKPSTTYLPDALWLQPMSVWFLGAILLLARFGIGTIAVRRMAKTAVPVAEDAWNRLTRELCSAIRIERPVRLLFSEMHLSPMTWGVLRHTILLPSSAAQWPEERRRLVLTHELAHVKRSDGLIQIFVQVVCSLHWFNPLVWYAAHRIHMERERACDDHVLRLGTDATDYADHLIQIVRGLRVQRRFSFAAVSMAQPSQLESRLVSILDSRTRRRTLSKAGTVFLLTVTTLLIVSIAAIGVTAAVPLPPVLVAAMKVATPVPPPESAAAKRTAAPQRTRIGDGTVVPNNAVKPPQVLTSFPPDYTPEAVDANVEGIVTLEAHVDIQGKVGGLRVVKGLGHGLDQKAIDAVAGWTFGPAQRDGAPVEAITQIEVDFRIPSWYKPAPADDMTPVKIGPGVTPPTVTFRVEPQYTPEARAARYQGTVVVSATVHQDGRLKVNEVRQELEYGLTKKAIEALEQWKFKPGVRDGKDVPVSLNIEVHFKLK